MVKWFDTAELVYNFSPNGLSRDCKKAIEFHPKNKIKNIAALFSIKKPIVFSHWKPTLTERQSDSVYHVMFIRDTHKKEGSTIYTALNTDHCSHLQEQAILGVFFFCDSLFDDKYTLRSSYQQKTKKV